MVSPTRRSTALVVGVLLVAGIAPALLLDQTGYDFLFLRERDRMRGLAWAALLLPLLSVPMAVRLGWHRRAAGAAERLATRWLALSARARGGFAVGVVLAGIGVGGVVLLGFHNSADEYAYDVQAHTYALGRVSLDPHPRIASIHFMHGKVIDGRWVSRFPPGWPLALTPLAWLGLPLWLLNPLIAAACAALLYTLGRRVFGERVGLLAAVLFVMSAFLLLNAGSYYSHPFAALLSVSFALAGERFLSRPSLGAAAVAGLAIGWLGLARHMNAPLLFAPFALALLWRRSPAHLLRLWPLVPCAGLFLGALLLYNQTITGDPFVLPTTVDDPKQALGFVHGHTPQRAMKFMQERLLLLPRYTSGLFLFLYAAALGRGALRRDLHWWDAYPVFVLFGYSLYHNSSHDTYGPRYLFEAFPFAALRIARACAPQPTVASSAVPGAASDSTRSAGWSPLFTWLVAVHLVSAAASSVGAGAMHARIIRERRDPYRAVAQAGLRDAVVIIASDTSPTRRMPRFDLVRNGVDPDAQSVIWAHAARPDLDALRAHYPGRSFWVYVREPEQIRGRLLPLERWLTATDES